VSCCASNDALTGKFHADTDWQVLAAGSAIARVRQLGIQWYIISDDERPGLDPERRQAVFAEGIVAVHSTDPERVTGRR